MRISDWSSDGCSSYLLTALRAQACAGTADVPCRCSFPSSTCDNAGISTSAPNMFQRNMKVSRIPMSAWNLIGENAQVTTPEASVTPTSETALPAIGQGTCRERCGTEVEVSVGDG